MTDANRDDHRDDEHDVPKGLNRTAIALVLFFGTLITFNVIFFATAFSTPPDVIVQPDPPAEQQEAPAEGPR